MTAEYSVEMKEKSGAEQRDVQLAASSGKQRAVKRVGP